MKGYYKGTQGNFKLRKDVPSNFKRKKQSMIRTSKEGGGGCNNTTGKGEI